MTKQTWLKPFTLVTFFTLALAACDNSPSEKAEDKVDAAIEQTQQMADDAGQKMDEMATDAGNAIEDKCEDIKESMNAEDTDC